MNIFIDSISTTAKIIIFDSKRKIISENDLKIKWNESSKLIPSIDSILKKNNTKYKDIENIVVVNWPWSFTGIRTTVLAINSINYITNKNLTAISYFDMFDSYPIIKTSSKRDCFIKLTKDSKIEIISNINILKLLQDKKINKIYWDINKEIFEKIEIFDKIDYVNIIKDIKFDSKKQIDPLYIKKPNIS